MADETVDCCRFSTLTCGVCRFPVASQQAWLWADQIVAGEHLASLSSLEGQVGDLSDELRACQGQPPASWTISHERCAPDTSGIFDIPLPGDHREFLKFAADVLAMPWVRGTDLKDLLREAATATERFASARSSSAPSI